MFSSTNTESDGGHAMTDIGYIRVSTAMQNTERQLDGVKIDKFYTDKMSGKNRNRPELKQCIKALNAGDTLHIHTMSRLSRSLKDLEELINELTDKGINVKFHHPELLFKATSDNKREQNMNMLMLRIMGSVAQFERENLKERQLEGIAKAKERKVYKGRQATLNRKPIIQMVESGMKKTDIIEATGISKSYLYQIIREHKAEMAS